MEHNFCNNIKLWYQKTFKVPDRQISNITWKPTEDIFNNNPSLASWLLKVKSIILFKALHTQQNLSTDI